MKNPITLFKILAVFIIGSVFSGCSDNIYYVGQTTTPLTLYSSTDTTSAAKFTLPANSKVLTKKKRKKYHYIIFESNTGYAFNPIFLDYHVYNSAIDGNMFGYSSTKPNSSYSSGTTSTSRSSGSGGSVNVKGYYRKDGTYVRPHTRSAPSRRRK